jgi:probable O-glycosylation ligase (exosortase A-associated)
MPLKGIIFIGLFLLCAVGALFLPYLGVYGYIADYCISPAHQWWEAPFSRLGIRYSLTLALTTAIGMLLQRDKLRFGESFLQRQEVLMLVFLGIVWLSTLMGVDKIVRYTIIDHPSVKFTKIVVFALMMTHIITDKRKLDGLLWVFVIVSLILGLQAWDLPQRAFEGGRLEGIGGADFAEANFFAAFMAAMLPIIGIQLLRSKWFGKAVCTVSAAFCANAIVLCRSRGAFMGIAAGVVAACLFAPKRHRKKIAVGLVLGMIGGIYVADPMFIERMSTITHSEEKRDGSAQSRILLWRVGIDMAIDNPLGIGVGNWYNRVGWYKPEYAGTDTHSTYVKCVVELGWHAAVVFAIIVFTAFRSLSAVRRSSPHSDSRFDLDIISFGLTISLYTYLACCITITLIYSEFLWLLLSLPVCLKRVLENAVADHEHEFTGETGESAQSSGNSDKQ